MAEILDLDEWELLSRNSSCEDEFDEEDDFAYFDYVSNDPERRGEISDTEKSARFDNREVMDSVVGEGSGGNLVKLSTNFDAVALVSSDKKGLGVATDLHTDNDCSDLTRGFDDNDVNFVRDDPTEELDASITCDEHDSICELGFGEMEVLSDFYLNQIDDGIVNYEKRCLTRENNLGGESEQFYSEKLNSSVFPFQGIDNSDSVFSGEPVSDILDWKSPKAILRKTRKERVGFFDMEVHFQNEISIGNCSNEFNGINSGTDGINDRSLNLSEDQKGQNISFDDDNFRSTEAEMGSKLPDGAKGEVLLSWWKVPVEVIKYCIFGVRPVWSISVAMGFLGFLMFGRSYYLYKMNQKDSKTRPALKVRFDEKVSFSFLVYSVVIFHVFVNFSLAFVVHLMNLKCWIFI
jgi:hypothetical protein